MAQPMAAELCILQTRAMTNNYVRVLEIVVWHSFMYQTVYAK